MGWIHSNQGNQDSGGNQKDEVQLLILEKEISHT